MAHLTSFHVHGAESVRASGHSFEGTEWLELKVDESTDRPFKLVVFLPATYAEALAAAINAVPVPEKPDAEIGDPEPITTLEVPF